jgi:hypothetical protein
MPTIRLPGEGEQEGIGTAAGAVASPQLARFNKNMALTDTLGKYIAGQVFDKYQNQDLANVMGGLNAIHVSVSWG